MDLQLARSDGVISTAKGSRAVVVSLEAESSRGADEALGRSVRVAQEALDVWAVKGLTARALAPVADQHLVCWAVDQEFVCRIWATTRIDWRLEARSEARDSEGNLIPPAPEPILDWHPSFRFFRLGQAATDLVDAFRNYYLGLESLLTSVEPMRMHGDGRPAEGEVKWLDRALAKAASIVDLATYARPGSIGDPIDAIRSEIYTRVRTSTFHAKSGAAVLMPHDDVTRTALRDTVQRVRCLYLDLAQEVLDVRFVGRGGLAPAGFRSMTSGIAVHQMYVSSEPIDVSGSRDVQLPERSELFDAEHAPPLDDEYRVAFVGAVPTSDLSVPDIQQFGVLHEGRVGIYGDLEGVLDTTGLDRIECVVAIEAQDPRALGTRYLS